MIGTCIWMKRRMKYQLNEKKTIKIIWNAEISFFNFNRSTFFVIFYNDHVWIPNCRMNSARYLLIYTFTMHICYWLFLIYPLHTIYKSALSERFGNSISIVNNLSRLIEWNPRISSNFPERVNPFWDSENGDM